MYRSAITLCTAALLLAAMLPGCLRDWSQYERRDQAGTGGMGGISGTTGGFGGIPGGIGGAVGGTGGRGGNAGTGGNIAGTGGVSCVSLDELEPCTCPDGRTSTRVCLRDGTLGECACRRDWECERGEPVYCICDGYSSGVAVCFDGEQDLVGCICRREHGEIVPFCGNGIIEGDEQCDWRDLRGLSCTLLGRGSGNLLCDERFCVIDTSQCEIPLCGNGVLNGIEQCDGNNLDGQSCRSLGEGDGVLLCDPADCTFDISMCTGSVGGTGGTGGYICENSCFDAYDGFCDDGGPDADYYICEYGTDCADCGPRP